jgi:hypothetical protein
MSPRPRTSTTFILEVAEAGENEYDALMKAAGRNPPGRLFHSAGPTDDGWIMVEVWDSREAFEAFLCERLLPAARRIGCFVSLEQSFTVRNLVARDGQPSDSGQGRVTPSFSA